MKILKILREKMAISQQKLATSIGVSRSAVAMWETDASEPDIEMLKTIANYFNVSVDYLLGIDSGKTENKKKATQVFVYGKIPAGIPFEAIEDIIDVEEIPSEMAKGGKEYFALKISGNSMHPNYIDGDVVIFEKMSDCENNDDCAVMVNGGDATFKRIEKKQNGIMLKPLNPEYETTFFSNDEIETLPVRVLGVARELRRKTLK